MKQLGRWIHTFVLLATVLAAPVAAQGIATTKNAVILYGATANCTQPATINWKRVRKATPEWKEIQANGVRKGTGRYDILISAMSDRIKQAAAAVADLEGRDCVIRKSDLRSAKGLTVKDITSAVISELGSVPSPEPRI